MSSRGYPVTETMRQERREAAALRRLADDRTPTERLDALDRRLGVGVGAVKERARLESLIRSSLTRGGA